MRTDDADDSVIGEKEDGADDLNSAEDEDQGEHKLEEAKARSKCKDEVARAHPSSQSGSMTTTAAKNRVQLLELSPSLPLSLIHTHVRVGEEGRTEEWENKGETEASSVHGLNRGRSSHW